MSINNFDELKFGDIIWCSRSFLKHVLQRPGHDQGPCIYLYHDDAFVYVLYGRGYRSDLDSTKNFILDENIVSDEGKKISKKKGAYALNKIYSISEDSCLFKIGSLDKKSKLNLSRQIRLVKPAGFEKIFEKSRDFIKTLSEGDIFIHNGKSYVALLIEDDCLFAIESCINKIGTLEYHTDSLELFDSNMKNFELINYVGDKTLFKLKDKCDFIAKDNVKKEACIGSVIENDGNMYYVSTIEKDFLICYSLQETDFRNCDINIDHRYYKIFFEQSVISKNDAYKVICSADANEIKNIHDLKSSRKKVIKLRANPEEYERKKNLLRYRLREEKFNKLSEKEIMLKFFGKVLHPYGKPNERLFALEISRVDGKWQIECISEEDLKEGKIISKYYLASDLVVTNLSVVKAVNKIQDLQIDYSNPNYNSFFMNQSLYRYVNLDDNGNDTVFVRRKFKIFRKSEIEKMN